MRLINLNLESGPGLPEGAVYIGRPHASRRLAGSKFANPFPLRDRNDEEERKQVLEQYRQWLWAQIQKNAITVEDLKALDGHDLACFCVPKLCHGMVVQKAVEWARDQEPGQDWTGVSNPIELPRPRSLSDWLKVKVR
jgi:hypothetical protein